MKTIALTVAALLLACAGGDSKHPSAGCPTSVVYEEPYVCEPEDNCPTTPHWVCPPEAKASITFDPTVYRCEWHCVAFACEAAPQDVIVLAGSDGTVTSVAFGDAQGCP